MQSACAKWPGLLLLVVLVAAHAYVATAELRVVDNIPGRAPSSHFRAWVRAQGTAAWTPTFVLQTTSKPADSPNGTGYFKALENWTHSWISVEVTGPIEVLVQRCSGPTPRSAAVHPRSSHASIGWMNASGVMVRLAGPSRIAVDIDGALDATDTGPAYKGGPPVHTFSVFADPMDHARPSADDPATRTVRPGDPIPNGTELPPNTTLLFAPGVHRMPPGPSGYQVWTLPADVRVYISNGAIVHAALDSGAWGAHNITLQGYGVFSGEELIRRDKQNNDSPQGITLNGVTRALVSGPTFVDFPNHHLMAQATDCTRSLFSNVKVLGWRANGDGIHVFGGWQVEKLFLRTQDDSMYTATGKFPRPGCEATTFSQITTWNDANGASFLLTGNGTRLSDSDVIYQRASWAWWDGGRPFSHRTDMSATENVTVTDVRVEDMLPSLNLFQFVSTRGSISNVRLRNIQVAARRTTTTACPTWGGGCNCVPACKPGPLPEGIPNIISTVGSGGNTITALAFENVTINGTSLGDLIKRPGFFNITGSGISGVTVDGKTVQAPTAPVLTPTGLINSHLN